MQLTVIILHQVLLPGFSLLKLIVSRVALKAHVAVCVCVCVQIGTQQLCCSPDGEVVFFFIEEGKCPFDLPEPFKMGVSGSTNSKEPWRSGSGTAFLALHAK